MTSRATRRGIVAPAGAPVDIVVKFNAEIANTLARLRCESGLSAGA